MLLLLVVRNGNSINNNTLIGLYYLLYQPIIEYVAKISHSYAHGKF